MRLRRTLFPTKSEKQGNPILHRVGFAGTMLVVFLTGDSKLTNHASPPASLSRSGNLPVGLAPFFLRMNELHLFAGAGGGILGGYLLGHTCVCAVEVNPFCRKVLLQRQLDGTLPRFPVWDDIRTFDGTPWRGHVDCVCGGFPCQDISAAGKGAGIEGERSGLWSEMARVLGEVRPPYVFVENSPRLTVRGLYRVLGDLSALGYDADWTVVSAADLGAPHERERLWIFGRDADESNANRNRRSRGQAVFSQERASAEALQKGRYWQRELGTIDVAERITSYSGAMRVLHGLAHRVDRLGAIGNGQVPAVAARAFQLLKGEP